MDKQIRKTQEEVLNVFAREAKDFALAGGTALEMYYLQHRFSSDLDFFSKSFDSNEINNLVRRFAKSVNKGIKLETEFVASNKARVSFFTIPISGSKRSLKLDFVEETIIDKPKIKKINGVRVYSVEDLYLHKVTAVSGVQSLTDEIGREIAEGRKQARDVFDVYMLSKKVEPLHIFLQNTPAILQRGLVHWYRTFSRQELKLALMDLDIYDPKFDPKEMIVYLENEIKLFTKKVIEE